MIDFYKAAVNAGIKPIIGCEVYVAPESRFDREAGGQGDDRYYHLVLLAENDTGYHNLMKIVSRGFTEGYYYKPRVDKELLEKYHEGIIALSACLAGEVARGLYEDAKKAALSYEKIFGKGNFFLELQDHGISAQATVNQALLRMSEETGIELVATNDIHYINAEDAEPHDVLLCIQTGKKVNDENRMRYTGCVICFVMHSRRLTIQQKLQTDVMLRLSLERQSFQSFLCRMATHQNSILRSFAVKDWCAVMVRRHHR